MKGEWHTLHHINLNHFITGVRNKESKKER